MYKPTKAEHVHLMQFRDDCVPHLRTLCGEMRSEARKSQLLRHKPKFDAEEAFLPDRGPVDTKASCGAAMGKWGGFWGPFVE